MPQPGLVDEAVVHDGLGLEDRLSILLNGVRREVRIVGIELSPGYVYAIAPG